MRLGIRGGAAFVVGVCVCIGARAADAPAGKATPLDQSVAGIRVPEGFKVSLFAGEPDIRQPIALTFDARGRLWVVECYAYPAWEMNGKPGRDRVLIFEDADGDGAFDKRTVFLETGTNLSGIELGFGGVWLCSTPNLLFIPDRDRDDKPDGPAEVVLDGWDLRASHNVFNGLIWGPDGWLWGCNGILSNSKVGRPGTPEAQRTSFNCGIWRYHPTRKVFEAVAHGTTNPWGLDFDDHGEAFLTNCVIPHLFHVVPGGHYMRMFGQDINPHSYELIKTCADHVHWDTTERWLDIRSRGVTPTTDKAGGGHAHSGETICLTDTWPESYRNTVLMGNIHGNRLNMDRLERHPGGYVAKHMPDFLRSSDTWFRSVAQKFGPDGSLYVLDWSDTGECHEHDADGAHRENGRIYRVSYGDPRPFKQDLTALDSVALAKLQLDKNDAKVRIGRRLLQERQAAGDDLKAAHAELRSIVSDHREDTGKLRALWSLNASHGIDRDGLFALFDAKSAEVRAWALRLAVDDRPKAFTNEQINRLVKLISEETSPRVVMAAASALSELPEGQQGNLRLLMAIGVLEAAGRDVRNGLRSRRADAPNAAALVGLSDAFVKSGYPDGGAMLSALVWYAIEPIIATGKWDGLPMKLLSSTTGFPRIQHDLARRMVEVDRARGLDIQTALLANDVPAAVAEPILEGVSEALEGRKSVPMPALWPKLLERTHRPVFFDDPKRLSTLALARIWRLSLLFGDPDVAAYLRRLVADASVSGPDRRHALEALAAFRVKDVVDDLLARLDDLIIRDDAIRALSAFDDPRVPRAMLQRYKSLTDKEREDAVATLSTRPAWALALLDAVSKSIIPREDVSATVARQLLAFNRPEVTQALEKSWGVLRPTAKDKAVLLSRYKERLATASKKADLERGRMLFQKTCQQCHKMYGEGGDVGPELTGSNRDNLDYVLENVLDPSSSVANEYKVTTVATTDGRLLSGIVKERTEAALVLRTPNDRVVVPRDEIEAEKASPSSMMPEGLIEKLDDDEFRDLIAFLAARR